MTTEGDLVPLSRVRPGRRAVVRGGPSYRRMLDLGLVPGTVVEVVRRAPLGDPVQLSLRGFYLAVRRDEAARILVREDP